MFSVRGVLSTTLAMMECASSQLNNTGIPRGYISGRRDRVFLLSELEKVWAALSVVLRNFLSEGKAVKISNFGSFWLEEFVLFTAPSSRSVETMPYRQQAQQRGGSSGGTKYSTRQLCFGFNHHYARKYNFHSEKILREKTLPGYAKIAPSHLVALCEVPAYRVMQILKEFFLYLGESIFLGKVFQLDFPEVATLCIRKEQMLLRPVLDLQEHLLEVDAKRWPSDVKERCKTALYSEYRNQTSSSRGSRNGAEHGGWDSRSVGSGRVSTSRSVPSHPAPSQSTLLPSSPAQHPTVFVSTAPGGRCFSELEQEKQRRAERVERSRRMWKERKKTTVDEATLQGEIKEWSNRHGEHLAGPHAPVWYAAAPPQEKHGDRQGGVYRPSSSGESVYAWDGGSSLYPNVTTGGMGMHRMQSHESRTGENTPEKVDTIPEVEVVEVTVDAAPHHQGESQTQWEGLPASSSEAHIGVSSPRSALYGVEEPSRVGPKVLASILEKEEPFSRPLSRRYHEHSSVRDLIYNNPCAGEAASFSRKETRIQADLTSSGRPIHRHQPPESTMATRIVDPSSATLEAPGSVPSASSLSCPTDRYGRKRFGDVSNPISSQKEYAMLYSLHNEKQQALVQ